MSWSSDMAKFVKEKKEQKRQEAESMQNRIFFTAVSVDLEEEKRKREEEERKRRELEWQEHLAWVEEKIAKGTPAKHVLYCNYPGAEFREEIDASKMESSYTEDYDDYREELDEILSELLGDQDFEKFEDRY